MFSKVCMYMCVYMYTKFEVDPLTVTQKKSFTFWDAKFVMTLHMLERLKQSSVFDLIIIKVNTDLFEKENNVPQKRFHSHYLQDCHKGINDWEVILFEKCETHKQIKERETFWQHKLKWWEKYLLKNICFCSHHNKLDISYDKFLRSWFNTWNQI